MKTYRDYLLFIENLKENHTDEKTVDRLNKLSDLILASEKKEVFTKDCSQIMESLSRFQYKYTKKPVKVKQLAGLCYNELINFLETDFGLVQKGYYRNKWLALGMVLFGAPFGVILFTLTQNPVFIGISIPIGMIIGLGIGQNKDKEAEKEGRILE